MGIVQYLYIVLSIGYFEVSSMPVLQSFVTIVLALIRCTQLNDLKFKMSVLTKVRSEAYNDLQRRLYLSSQWQKNR